MRSGFLNKFNWRAILVGSLIVLLLQIVLIPIAYLFVGVSGFGTLPGRILYFMLIVLAVLSTFSGGVAAAWIASHNPVAQGLMVGLLVSLARIVTAIIFAFTEIDITVWTIDQHLFGFRVPYSGRIVAASLLSYAFTSLLSNLLMGALGAKTVSFFRVRRRRSL